MAQVKEALQLDPTLHVPAAIREANRQIGFPNEGTLPVQTDALMEALGSEHANGGANGGANRTA